MLPAPGTQPHFVQLTSRSPITASCQFAPAFSPAYCIRDDRPCTGLYASVQQPRALLVETHVIGVVELRGGERERARRAGRAAERATAMTDEDRHGQRRRGGGRATSSLTACTPQTAGQSVGSLKTTRACADTTGKRSQSAPEMRQAGRFLWRADEVECGRAHTCWDITGHRAAYVVKIYRT
ncbi:hypothetical protein L226DRAFT_256170 [Lentinus tigrinus ALCF2SS1-7]|uniref:uncharacterized protein n=1 Tax=Lentinus tigrinus ALCF2SS1-7 TaxID=1328758 RepID=UPI001165F9AC|nr:hypothetical protein L226DRAFT_256170 [Lentinus tigrinus ALCF2SS1-7]